MADVCDRQTLLPLGADRLDRVMQLVLRRMQMLFRLRAMPSHIVVVSGAGMVHFMDRFLYVVMDRVQIVPVTNSIGNRDPSNK